MNTAIDTAAKAFEQEEFKHTARMEDNGIGYTEAWGISQRHVKWELEVEGDGLVEITWRSMEISIPKKLSTIVNNDEIGDEAYDVRIVGELIEAHVEAYDDGTFEIKATYEWVAKAA